MFYFGLLWHYSHVKTRVLYMGLKVSAFDLIAHRDIYSIIKCFNDNPVKKKISRIYEAAKPILCLFKPFDKFHHYYDPFQKSVEDVRKGVESCSEKKYVKLSKDLLDIALSISALITSFYESAFGLCLSAVRDLGINSYQCATLVSEKKTYLEIAIKIVSAVTNCLSLVGIFYGCLRLEIISLGILLVTELISGIHEFMKRDYLMCTSRSSMFFVRIHQMIGQGKKLKEKPVIKKVNEKKKANFVKETAGFTNNAGIMIVCRKKSRTIYV